MVNERVGAHQVEGRIGEGQRFRHAAVEPDVTARQVHAIEHRLGDVHAVYGVEQLLREIDDEAGAAAEVQQPRAAEPAPHFLQPSAYLGAVFRPVVRLVAVVGLCHPGVDLDVGLDDLVRRWLAHSARLTFSAIR